MLAKIQIPVVYFVLTIVLSIGTGVGAEKAYNAFQTARHPERQFYSAPLTLMKLTAAYAEQNEQVRTAQIRETLATDRADFG